MNKVVAIVGMCGSGKSVASSFFEEKGYEIIYFGKLTLEKLKEEGLEINPENEKYMKKHLRDVYGPGAYASISIDKIKESLKTSNVVIDGLYSWSEFTILKEEFKDIILIGIITDKNHRYDRLSNREIRPFTKEESLERDIFEIENIEKGGPIAFADYYIFNNETKKEYEDKLQEIYNTIEKRS